MNEQIRELVSVLYESPTYRIMTAQDLASRCGKSVRWVWMARSEGLREYITTNYNPNARYLPILTKTSIPKCFIDKHLAACRKMSNGFNGRPAHRDGSAYLLKNLRKMLDRRSATGHKYCDGTQCRQCEPGKPRAI